MITCSAAVSACEKAAEWTTALCLGPQLKGLVAEFMAEKLGRVAKTEINGIL